MTNARILLKPLTMADAKSFYALHKNPGVNHGHEPFLPNENAIEFTSRLMAACVEIYTIRLAEQEETIIGDCALHDPDYQQREIEIGGSLLPAFQGKGYMREAFRLLGPRAKEQHGMHALIAKTGEDNRGALLLMNKLGYTRHAEENGLMTFRKPLLTINE